LATAGDTATSKDEGVHPRTRNNYLRLLYGLALNVEGFDPKHPFTAAKLVIDASGVQMDQGAVAGYLKDAYELVSKESE
jgi:hypothetical protein